MECDYPYMPDKVVLEGQIQLPVSYCEGYDTIRKFAGLWNYELFFFWPSACTEHTGQKITVILRDSERKKKVIRFDVHFNPNDQLTDEHPYPDSEEPLPREFRLSIVATIAWLHLGMFKPPSDGRKISVIPPREVK